MNAKRTYAARTDVPITQTRDDIEALVRRYGATGFVSGWQDERASVQFLASGRIVRFVMTMPPGAQEQRSKWRALLLIIKAKLESVASGIATFESEFLANIVLPDGRTVYEATKDNVALAYSGQDAPTLLPDYSRKP